MGNNDFGGGLLGMLAAAAGEDLEGPAEGRKLLSQEEQLKELNDFVARFTDARANGPRFEVGDLVTCFKASTYNGAGEPHIVVERRDPSNAIGCFEGGEGWSSNSFGATLDMRVAHFVNGGSNIALHWVESAFFEPWLQEAEVASDISDGAPSGPEPEPEPSYASESSEEPVAG